MVAEDARKRPIGDEFFIRGSGIAVIYLLGVYGSLTENRLRRHIPYTSMLRALGDLEQAGFIMRPEQVEQDSGRLRGKSEATVTVWMLTPVGRRIAHDLLSVGEFMDGFDLANADDGRQH